MSLPLVYRPEIADDLAKGFGWYEERHDGLGDTFLEAVSQQLEWIQTNPDMYGKLYREVRAASMRRFPYVIYFRAQSDRIEVIAIQHGHRHQRHWRKRV